eukprot:9194800-Pyramimonas_sp.AAC.1
MAVVVEVVVMLMVNVMVMVVMNIMKVILMMVTSMMVALMTMSRPRTGEPCCNAPRSKPPH